MFVQRLIDYADRLDSVPKGYSKKTLNWVADIDYSGRWIGTGFVQLDKGTEKVVPFLARSGTKITPILLYDKAEYVLGCEQGIKDEKAKRKVVEKQNEFRKLVEECVKETKNSLVQVVLHALQEENIPPLPKEMNYGDWVTFRVDGKFPIDEPSVQTYWKEYLDTEKKEERKEFICIGCGKLCTPMKRHDIPIKLRGGHSSGTKLISANDAAYFSYGLINSLISPTCDSCSEKYAKSLNDLLMQPETHRNIENLSYIFWTKQPTSFSLISILDNPDPQSVNKMFNTVFTGSINGEVDTNEFYAAALSPYFSRIVVRDWMETTLNEVQNNLVHWFKKQKIETGKEFKYFGLYSLAACFYRDARKEMVPNTPLFLLQHALYGKPLPRMLLVQALRRCTAEREVTSTRAAFLKLYLLQNPDYREDEFMDLETQRTEPAYLCGRLLSVLEYVQSKAIGNPNTTLVDRYYGTASTSPASVFSYLIRNAQNHLSKLRRDKSKYGLYVILEKQIEDIVASLSYFPKHLAAEEQALFAIGFYHQKHENYKKATTKSVNLKGE